MNTKGTYILHLCSWYPSRVNQFDGDFIQRHIDCLARSCKNVVLHVQSDPSLKKWTFESTYEQKNGIETYIVYLSPTNRIIDFVARQMAYFKGWRNIKKKHGSPNLVHVHVTLYAGLFAIILWAFKKLPFVITEHSTLYIENNISFIRRINKWLAFKIMRKAHTILPVSEHLKNKLSINIRSTTFLVVPNVVPEYFFKVVKKRKSSKDIFRLIHVSSLNDEQKNITGIIKVLVKLRTQRQDFVFTLVGCYNISKTEDLIDDIVGINNWVKILGPVTHEEVAEEMAKSDIFVLFSNSENLPCVLLEALAVGVPCVATDVGGVSEIIDSTNGVLIQSRSEHTLHGALIAIMNDFSIFQSKRIRNSARSNYSSSEVATKMMEVYQQVEIECL